MCCNPANGRVDIEKHWPKKTVLWFRMRWDLVSWCPTKLLKNGVALMWTICGEYLVSLECCAWAWHSSFRNWKIFLFVATSESSKKLSAEREWRRKRFPSKGGERFAARKKRRNRRKFRSWRRRSVSSFVWLKCWPSLESKLNQESF